jgi:hypothetical protein
MNTTTCAVEVVAAECAARGIGCFCLEYLATAPLMERWYAFDPDDSKSAHRSAFGGTAAEALRQMLVKMGTAPTRSPPSVQ